MTNQPRGRAVLLPVIHSRWKKLRPDLAGDPQELRDQRLEFASAELNRPVNSLKELTVRELGKLADALRSHLASRPPAEPPRRAAEPRPSGRAHAAKPEQPTPRNVVKGSFGKQPTQTQVVAAEVTHMASSEQGWLISALFDRLKWPFPARSNWLVKKFKTNSTGMLTKEKAQSAITILLTIICSAEIKAEHPGEPVSRAMVKQRIPKLLTELKRSTHYEQ